MRTNIDFLPLLELMGLMLIGRLIATGIGVWVFNGNNLEIATQKPLIFLAVVALSLLFAFGLPAAIWLRRHHNLVRENWAIESKTWSYISAIVVFVCLVFAADYFMSWIVQFLALRGWEELVSEAYNIQAVRSLLQEKSMLPLVILVVSLLPALVEEFFFRRIIMNYMLQASKNFWVPALISSLFFSAMHEHFASFFPIFLLGMGLAYAYYVTKNIWTSIILHGLNNAISISLIYLGIENNNTPWFVALFSMLIAVYLYQKNIRNGNLVLQEPETLEN